MSVPEILSQLILGPLTLLLDVIYEISFLIFQNAGAAIIPLSLAVNFFLLPFYLRADSIQQEERLRQDRMAPGLAHIRKTFKGDERYMMVQTFYRQNHYKPVYSLRSALSLFLQIPFFIAAYRFLSTLPELNMAAFGPISDLSAPDGLIRVGGVSVNLLPILMTVINILSGMVYTKGQRWKEKASLYGMALVFLVILYNSPSGLVFYWTLNNLFSLAKNLVCAAKNRPLVVRTLFSALGAFVLLYAALWYPEHNLKRVLLLLVGLLFQLPAVLGLLRGKREKVLPAAAGEKPDVRLFLYGCVFLTVLTGLLIPSAVVRSSPMEFVILSAYRSPLVYVLSAFLLAAGTFLIWFGLFYYLADAGLKRVLSAGVWLFCGVAVTDYMFFGTNLGNLSPEMKYDLGFYFGTGECLRNALVLLLVCAVLLALLLWKRKLVTAVYPLLILALLGVSASNIAGIQAAVPQLKQILEQETREKASFPLSRDGKNVVVFMLDRGIGSYVPYLLQENPELEKQFDGFTWYPNTLSYGTNTITGAPALFGGYEYTPEEMNRRADERLEDKHNEALKLLPALFRGAGYEVTVCDPPLAGYTWIPTLSVFKELDGVKTYNTVQGQFNDQKVSAVLRQRVWKRNIFCYSVMKVSPLFVQAALYQQGTYFNHQSSVKNIDLFINSYSVLCALPDMTEVVADGQDTFLMMANDTTHNVILLSEPEYEPAVNVDNAEYDRDHADRFILDGREMAMDAAYQMESYQCNMAAFRKLGAWFDFLREQGVWDNTRIIIASDHGYYLEQFPDLLFEERTPGETEYNSGDGMAYNPLLLVKDFDSRGFTVDGRFMTNADAPSLALAGLVEDPVNPYTGKPVSSDAKNAEEQHVFYTDFWGTDENNGNVFQPGIWYALKNQDLFDRANWERIGEY